MKVKNLLWSGCSFSAGSSFSQRVHWTSDSEEFIFSHPNLKKWFNPPYTIKNVKQQIRNITFPVQLGHKIGCDLIKNFSVGGMGYPIHTRKIFSYLISNPDKLDFSETVVGIQLTSFQRDEVLRTHINGNIDFSFLDGMSGEDHARDYILKYWNPSYSVMKSLQELLIFKGWCESVGVKIHYFCFNGFMNEQILPYANSIKVMKSNINYAELTHDYIDFPDLENIISKLEIIELPEIDGGTFITDGYHSDTHFSPEGHSNLSNILFDIFKNKLNYEI